MGVLREGNRAIGCRDGDQGHLIELAPVRGFGRFNVGRGETNPLRLALWAKVSHHFV